MFLFSFGVPQLEQAALAATPLRPPGPESRLAQGIASFASLCTIPEGDEEIDEGRGD